MAVQIDDLEDPTPRVEEEILTDEEEEWLGQGREIFELRRDVREMKWRERYSAKIFWLMLGWLGFVAIAIILSAVGSTEATRLAFEIENPVMIALITTTTINVVGLFYIVARYFYKANEE